MSTSMTDERKHSLAGLFYLATFAFSIPASPSTTTS